MDKFKCPCCVDGKQTISCSELGSKEPPEKIEISCYWCEGSGFVDSKTLKAINYEKNMWCKCEKPDPHDTRYYKDNQHPVVSKHHWRCNKCNGVTQIG